MIATAARACALAAALAAAGLTAAFAEPSTAPPAATLSCVDAAPATLAPDVSEVLAVLCAQQAAWNAGDIPGFMAGYWRSEALRFASGGSVTTGWQETADRYAARYDTRDKMGVLAFTDLDMTLLSEDAAVVFGRWRLQRAADAPEGLFTLIVRRIDGAWVVVHDHTSSAG